MQERERVPVRAAQEANTREQVLQAAAHVPRGRIQEQEREAVHHVLQALIHLPQGQVPARHAARDTIH